MKFSIKSYEKIITSFLKSGYEFLAFNQLELPEKSVHLRHDIDCSMLLGTQFAEINDRLGVSGCFFVNIRSELYNFSAYPNLKALEQVRERGQAIGLHFCLPPDFALHRGDILKKIQPLVERDYNILNDVIRGMANKVISWHNPSGLGEKYRELIGSELPGFLNVNSLNERGIVYKSDSNHRYSVQEWLDMSKQGPKNIQILMHPFQWALEAGSMEETLAKYWLQLVGENENALITNHCYGKHFPNGMPKDALREWVRPLLDLGK